MQAIKASALALSGGLYRDTMSFKVEQNAHDGYTYDGSDSSGNLTLSTTAGVLYLNDIDNTRFDNRAFGHMTAQSGRSLPANATIVSADLSIYAASNSSSRNTFRLAFEKAVSPTTLTAKSELAVSGGRSKTSLLSYSPPTNWVNGNVYTVDMTAQLQEVRAVGAGVITKVNVFLLHGVNGYGGSNNVYPIFGQNKDPNKAISLDVTYDVPA